MADRKAPNLPPSERPDDDPISRQVKPEPPPAPPPKKFSDGPLANLTLRDWFAAKALSFVKSAGTEKQLAEQCYAIADAMLKARGE